jgi:hypothetical protein
MYGQAVITPPLILHQYEHNTQQNMKYIANVKEGQLVRRLAAKHMSINASEKRKPECCAFHNFYMSPDDNIKLKVVKSFEGAWEWS